jgi:branched-chain amino acid transport system ATP-binding protein
MYWRLILENNNILTVEDLSLYYGHICALRNVNLEVNAGEIVSPIGSNGSGKSSLMKAVLGIHRVSGGRIIFMGNDITSWSTTRIVTSGIVYIPEGGGVLPLMTVKENLLLGALHYKGDVNKRMEQIFGDFPILKQRQKQQASTLSGGERQMLAIGRALMGSPKLLMMDEPSLGIAPKIVTEIFNMIKVLRDTGYSILLSEQNAKKAMEYSDRSYVFQTGNIIMHGSSRELLNNPDVQRVYLGG